MRRYKHILITNGDIVGTGVGGKRLVVGHTDEETFNWLVSEIENLMPSCKVTFKNSYSNVVYMAKIERLEGNDELVFAWALNRLCEEGFEPYSVIGTASKFYTYYLRKLIQE